jgi:two-component system chemotaxis response regulator CheY
MGRLALVVDDSMLIRHTVCRYLEERGFSVESASNGQEALEMLAALHPDIIVTDMQMPKMGGSELISALKSKQETAKIPVVILSAKKSSPQTAEENIANYVIYKDIDIETQLQKALMSALGEGAIGES